MGNKAKGDIVKTQRADMHTKRGSNRTNHEGTDLVIENNTLDREAIARLAYFYWEARGCPYDSDHEDWFRAEAELRKQFAAAADGLASFDSDRI
jgi:hypothetical protein